MNQRPQLQALNTNFSHYGSIEVAHYEVPTADQYPLAIHRLQQDNAHTLPPLVLVHGAYSNRHFWISPKGKGIAGYLASQGFDVWLLETRGHGLSRNETRYNSITVDDIIQHDFACATDFIAQHNPQEQLWLGHSYGGLYLSLALGTGAIPNDRVSGFGIVGTQLSVGQEYLKFRPLAWLIKLTTTLMGRFPAKALGMGGEDEAPRISNQFIDWKSKHQYRAADGTHYHSIVSNLQIPLLAIAGGGDTIDPAAGCKELFHEIGGTDKTYWLMAKAEGWTKDYGHVDMIIGKEAEQESWPKIAQWLRSKVPATTPNNSPEKTPEIPSTNQPITQNPIASQ